ncbi:sensor histidine kinase N-terminal domain-containing protein [Legionella pneumophila]|nr:sensor histidine kinase N-terminal domain-containing protein [Legionella pneumophila]
MDKFNFQVWTNGGKLLLHSPTAPKIPLTAETDGFSDKRISNQDWRVFTTYNDKAGIRTVLAERYDTRMSWVTELPKMTSILCCLLFHYQDYYMDHYWKRTRQSG